MCGVHNYTKDLTVHNLHSFVMKGTEESRSDVIINHQFTGQCGKPSCTIIQFVNVSFVNITNLIMRCPSINLTKSFITVKNFHLYGYAGTKESLSFISITGRESQAFLNNCTFRENCFIVSDFSDGIIVSNSTFRSYRHEIKSILGAKSSVVTLIGNVNFTDSIMYHSVGTAVLPRTTHSELRSTFNISTSATVYFVNLTCYSEGGAVYADNAVILVGAKANVVFMHNSAPVNHGGAIWLRNGTLNVHSNVSLTFSHSSSYFLTI